MFFLIFYSIISLKKISEIQSFAYLTHKIMFFCTLLYVINVKKKSKHYLLVAIFKGHNSIIPLIRKEFTNIYKFYPLELQLGNTGIFYFIKSFSSFLQFFIHGEQIFDSSKLPRILPHQEHNILNLNSSRPSNVHCLVCLPKQQIIILFAQIH